MVMVVGDHPYVARMHTYTAACCHGTQLSGYSEPLVCTYDGEKDVSYLLRGLTSVTGRLRPGTVTVIFLASV